MSGALSETSPFRTEGVAVARPFSGDVLVLDEADFAVRGSAYTGGEPLQAVLASDSEVIGRDWKSGRILRGRVAAS